MLASTTMIPALTVVAALTSSGSATALHARQVDQVGQDGNGESTGSNGDPLQDVNIFCRGHDGTGWDLNSEGGAKQVWIDTGTHLLVDKFIQEHGPYQWLKNFEAEVDPGEARSETGNCGVMAADCGGGSQKSCEAYFEDGSHPWMKNAYWVWEALEGLHTKVNSFHGALMDQTTWTGLDVDKLVADLGGNPEEDSTFSDIAGWISQAIGVGGTLTGASNFAGATGISTGLSILSTVAAMVAKADGTEEGVDAADIKASLVGFSEKMADQLERLLALSVGLVEDEEAYKELPVPAESEVLETSIGTFFSNGWSLLHQNSDVTQQAIDAIAEGIRVKVIDLILQEAGYMLVGIDPEKREGGCSDADGSGEYMMETNNGDQYCFYMAKPTEYNKINYISKAGDDIFKVMAANGIESPYAYYQQILQCQRPRDSDAPEFQPSDELQSVGGPVLCLYNMATAIVEDIDRCDVNLGETGVSPCTDYELKDIELNLRGDDLCTPEGCS